MASTKLSRTAGTPTSNKKFTISYWVKRSNIGSAGNGHIFDTYVDSTNRSQIHFDDDNVIDFRLQVSGSNTGRLKTNRVFRNTSAWYHIVASVDTTLGTADDRVKLYINGVQETSFSSRTNPSQNSDFPMAGTHTLGAYGGGTNYFDGTLTHVHFTDGYSYAPTVFGETDSTSGIWKPKTAPSVTYGTNGFFLKFENSGAMGTDSSGNGNNFTVAGTLTQNVDTPSNNFPIINKAMPPSLASNATLSNGNLTSTSNTSDYSILCSMGVNKGKWYWEVKMGNAANTRSVGVVRADQIVISGNSSGFYPGGNGNATNFTSAWNGANGFVQTNTNGTQTQVTSNVTTLASGDIAGVALDLDNYTLKFYKNGTLDGTATLSAAWIEDFVLPCARADHNQIMHFNFGSGYFGTTAVSSANADANGHGIMEYAVPTGYYTLNTKNIKEFG